MTALPVHPLLRWENALARATQRRRTGQQTDQRWRAWAFEAFCAAYLISPAFRLLPAQVAAVRPVPEEAPDNIVAFARALVQHPVELEARQPAAQVIVNPAWLDDWKLANSAACNDPRLRRFHYDPDPNRARYNYRAPDMTIRRPVTLAEAIRQVYDEDIERLIDQALTTGDHALLPDRYHLTRSDRSVYLIHDDLLGQEDGRLLVGYSLNGETPQRVATWPDLRQYIERVKTAQKKRDALTRAA